MIKIFSVLKELAVAQRLISNTGIEKWDKSKCMAIFFMLSSLTLQAANSDSSITQHEIWFYLCVLLILVFAALQFRSRRRLTAEQKTNNTYRQNIQNLEHELQMAESRLEEQINYSDKQNELIHEQTIELEKHRHHLEKTVELRTQELKIAKEKAEESNRLKTSFLENISHEIRTPMNAIIGFSSLLKSPDIDNESRLRYVSLITSNSDSLLQLMEDILMMSKIQADQMQVFKSKFSVREILEELYTKYRENLKSLGLDSIHFELSHPESGRDFILYSDPQHIKRILNHLLSNGFKYCDRGTITLGYKPLFHSDYEKEPFAILFFVEDTGIGIPPEKTNFIFESFSKIESRSAKLYRGAGLGLYISKHLVEALGGSIWVSSKENEGSTFSFSIPYFDTSDVETQKEKRARKKKKSNTAGYDWKTRTILIVEDEQNNFILLAEILKLTGSKILEAKNGIQAVDLVRSENKIDLVLMDLMMPEMNGYEATREIKKLRPTLPVIAQTAYSDAKQREKSLETGCDGYISKPYNPPELLKLISNFL